MNNENGLTPSQLAERNATLVTEIEKCRELSGCPAGVDLQDWVKQLAAENVRLAAENKMAVDAVTVFSNVTHDVTEIICDELGHDRVAEIVAAYNDLGNMPATDRIVAGIKADAANQICVAFVKHKEFAGLSDDDVVTVREATDAVLHCAEMISEGADK